MNKVVMISRYHRRKAESSLPGIPSRQVRYVSKEAVEQFFAAVPRAAIRDALLFDLMYRYGLRREEATLIERAHVRDRIWITRVKGGISREYPIFRRTRRLLWSYLPRVGESSPHLFPSPEHMGTAISTSLVYQLFHRYATAAELPEDRRFPHVFRHSIAVHLLNAGWDLVDVKDWLGHVSIASTQVYARVSNIRLDQKVRALRSSEIAAL